MLRRRWEAGPGPAPALDQGQPGCKGSRDLVPLMCLLRASRWLPAPGGGGAGSPWPGAHRCPAVAPHPSPVYTSPSSFVDWAPCPRKVPRSLCEGADALPGQQAGPVQPPGSESSAARTPAHGPEVRIRLPAPSCSPRSLPSSHRPPAPPGPEREPGAQPSQGPWGCRLLPAPACLLP